MWLKARIPREMHSRIEKLRPSLVRVAQSWCHDTALAEDLAQESLSRALQHYQQLRQVERFEPWVFSILNNCWREHLRKSVNTEDIDELILPDDCCSESAAISSEIVNRVRCAIATLPLAQRQVITLIDLQGFSYADVALALQIPSGTVMSRLHRARSSLRDKLLRLHQENRQITSLRSVK